MAKTKKPPRVRESIPKLPAQPAESPAQQQAPWFRETVESIVIAFVLAFLFRTFEAEAFVIPTGSMAPTLMGRHKDVNCTQCGHRFQVTASEEESDEAHAIRAQQPQFATALDCVAGICPMCRYTMPLRDNLPAEILDSYPATDVANHRSYNGDRILVNKFIYTVSDPQRWDVVVFKFPGDAQMNYIKRLVGLPGETLQIFHGDLFTKQDSDGPDAPFQIEHKPPDKVLAMRQLVHDTDYDPAMLYTADWPLRWNGPEGGAWQVSAEVEGQRVKQRYSVDGPTDDTAWIRYRHYVPDYRVWRELLISQRQAGQDGRAMFAAGRSASAPPKLPEDFLHGWQPQLVMDFNAYNTRVTRKEAIGSGSLATDLQRTGLHWVGDLMVEADIEVQESRGELVLDLVEGGPHFTCHIDLTSGQAKLSAGGLASYAPTAKTMLAKPGRYRVGFANIDDRLLLFVKERSLLFTEFSPNDLVAFDSDTSYDAHAVFGDREQILPTTSEVDPGDLAPAGVGANGAKLAVSRLQMWRDIYYIADRSRQGSRMGPISDFDNLSEQVMAQLAFNPAFWPNFLDRRRVQFQLGTDQFFVMGDNSPESSDARLWRSDTGRSGGKPGGHYLERTLLIGKALCVYWPHSWNCIPGTPIPFPLFPNVEDMRLVR